MRISLLLSFVPGCDDCRICGCCASLQSVADKIGRVSDKIAASLANGDNTLTGPGTESLPDVAHQDDKKKIRQATLSRADTDRATIWADSQPLLMLSATAL